MQTHYISGAWFDTNDKIIEVLMHQINPDGTFQFGEKTTLEQVIYGIQHEKAVVNTITWNYLYPGWEVGPEVIVSEDGYLEYSDQNPDKLKLENVIKMNAIINL